jgi:hypothetical protein
VRAAVGGATTPADRLATIRRFYPDAQPVAGGNNFVFRNPSTGRLTLYQPEEGGPGLGTLGSMQPEIAEGLGSAAGVAGAVAAAPATLGASLFTIPAAAGLGAAAGRQLEQGLMTATGERVDTRSLAQQAVDAAKTAAYGAGGQVVGDVGLGLLGAGVRRLLTSTTPRGSPQQVMDAFTRLGVRAPIGAVSGRPSVQALERSLADQPGGISLIRGGMRQTTADLARAQEAAALRVGGAMSPQEAGGVVQAGATGVGQRFAGRQQMLDQLVEQTVGADTAVPVRNVMLLRLQLQREMAGAPAARRPEFARAISELDGIIHDATTGAAGLGRTPGSIRFGDLRGIRTRIGTELDYPDVSGYIPPGARRGLQRVYDALRDDIRAAAQAAGPRGQRALDLHDRYVARRRGSELDLPLIEKVTASGTPEKAWQFLMAEAKQGGTRLDAMRRQLRPQEWNEVVSSVVSRLGRAKPGGQDMPVELLGAGDTFSPSTFMTNYMTLSPEAKNALFGGSRYARLRMELDDLVRASSAMKESEKLANPAGTGRNLFFQGLLATPVAAGGLALTGQTGAAAGTLGLGALGLGSTQLGARLMTSPQFVRWLAQGALVGTNPGAISRHLARLGSLAVEPDVREAIGKYRDIVSDALARQGIKPGLPTGQQP